MGGDYTRFTFDPVKAYNGVLRQQGRVGIEADPNEAAEIIDRRWRSETFDILVSGLLPTPLPPPPLDLRGYCVVPATTADAFRITPTAPGAFTIGIGRAYVDGIQIENFGVGDPEWDPILAELKWPDAVPYDAQPFLPQPPDLTAGGAAAPGKVHLIYVAVRYREIDYLVDPEIREKALGGPDTGTRVQTVWQVRGLALGAAVACDDDVPEWNALIAPSAARLTTSTEAPQPSENPCILSPEGGYRGPENRLYRVEKHVAADGTMGVKWSEDNASVKAAVLALDGFELTVSTLGRDAILRFGVDDWIEVVDEHSDLDPARSGEMARIVDIDEAERKLILDRDLDVLNLFDPTDAERRTRVVRWDQGNAADPATGLIPFPATFPAAPFQFALEDGIRVTLEVIPAAGPFHAEDHWVFAARTADSSVEELVQAPPRGVHYHYARLAVVTWPNDVDDCRDPWPPVTAGGEEGCCTVVVHPGESIQAAIDSLPPAGGCVCLKVGDHPIDEPIVIARPNVHLHGESPGARILGSGFLPLLYVGFASDVVVESLDLVADPGPEPGGISVVAVNYSLRVEFERVSMLATSDDFLEEIAGAALWVTNDVRFSHCRFEGVTVGVYSDVGARLVVEDSAFTSRMFFDFLWGQFGVITSDEQATVVRNRFDSFQTGVLIQLFGFDSRVEGNRIRRVGLWAFDYQDPGVFAIEVYAAGTVVRDNWMDVPTSDFGGIRLAAQATRAETNWIESTIEAGTPLPIGILVEEGVGLGGPGLSSGGALASDGVVVAGNRLYGEQDGVVVAGTQGTVVRDNHLETLVDEAWGWGIHAREAADTVIAGNRVQGFYSGILVEEGRGSRVERNHVIGGSVGIAGDREDDLHAAGNVVERAALCGCIFVQSLRSLRIEDSRVIRCGWRAEDIGAGIMAEGSLADVTVSRCEVLDTAVPPEDEDRKAKRGIGIYLPVNLACRVQANLVSYSDLMGQDPDREDRALWAAGFPSLERGRIAFGSALVLDNKFLGPGRSALVELFRVPEDPDGAQPYDLRFEKVNFSNNHCWHLSVKGGDERLATVRLHGSHLVVMGNHVKATQNGLTPTNGFFSFDFYNNRMTLIGNISSGGYLNPGASVPAPALNLNIISP